MTRYSPKDVTLLLLEAESSPKQWSQETMLLIADRLTILLPDYILDWDEGSGEDWATVANKDNSLVVIRRDKPLSLIANFVEPSGIELLKSYGVTIIEAGGWNDKSITFDFSKLQRETPSWLEHTKALLQSSDNSLSLRDLWWSTV